MRGICFIGAGKMATAIAGGMVRKNIKTEIHTFDPFAAAAEQFCKLTCGTAHPSPVAALEHADVILLAVKPQYLTEAVAAFREAIGERLVISIVAGATIASLEALTGTRRIVRVMPNTPALVGEGMSCFCGAAGATEDDMKKAGEILSSFGLCRKVPESMLDAVTGLSGSGPAYVLEFIMALADGGVYAGLPRDAAIELAAQTVFGSALMVLKRGKEHPAVLRDAVISPGGTTARGVAALDEGAFRSTVMKAVVAAAERSAELGKQ